MGTRSNIIIKRPGSEEYAGIYCRWDGYLSHHGTILLQNYSTYDKVVELISLGNLSELHNTPDNCVSHHHWPAKPKNIQVSDNANKLSKEEYCYLFKNDKWYFKSYVDMWSLLTSDLCV